MVSGPSAYPLLFAKRTRMNQDVVTWFAIILSSLMGVFIVFHLSRLFAQKTGLASKLSGATKPFVFVSRIVRRYSVLKFPALPSTGHAVIALLYIVVNVVLLLTYLDDSLLPYITVVAARAGWLAIANIVFVIFLSLKNTPLGYLTAWSYERLNVLHQIAGYVTMALIIVHGATYSSYFIEANNAARLRVHEEIYGIASGFTFLTLVVAGAVVRFWSYELFYVIHVSFFAISMVLVGLHQPEMTKKIIIATALGSALWLSDRILRFFRVAYYSINNTATVYPLPHGGTRVVLKKAPIMANSGEHCFLWIPKIRAFEMHPFTIANMDPLEFVINSYDGFTRDLHRYATSNPGATVKASVEGSYGRFPNPAEYDKIVLVAGGSGASFTFGMALNLLKRIGDGAQKSIVFVWMVKDPARFEWFSESLATINRALNSSIQLYVTRSPGSHGSSQEDMVQTDRSRSGTISSDASTPFTPATEKFDEAAHAPRQPSKVLTRTVSDPEKSGNESDLTTPTSPIQQATVGSHINNIPIHYGRPDVSKIITKAIEEAPANQRVLVMGCGPATLMTQVRNTTASHIRTSGPAVELHCEQFGW
ncbi:ferric reductase transmembrane component 5 [Colletotrichum chrysophilum]|uniref:Ferric reductase transmembrane component 5 n=1 Tax=Colletotrichum chrysophilum TaxID=1836956 RepID=A0AAD9ASE9_9PEZI|nr:ferric reductase transmembrane component 5 [Colletotrichum chrysophilum]